MGKLKTMLLKYYLAQNSLHCYPSKQADKLGASKIILITSITLKLINLQVKLGIVSSIQF